MRRDENIRFQDSKIKSKMNEKLRFQDSKNRNKCMWIILNVNVRNPNPLKIVDDDIYTLKEKVKAKARRREVPQVVGFVSLGYPFSAAASIIFGRHHKSTL